MFLETTIREYLLYLRHEQNASAATQRCYRYALQRFVAWLAANGHPKAVVADITTPVARHYLYYLSDQKLRPRTRLRLWAPIRSLFRMLVEQQVLETSPVEKVALPKKDPAVRLLVSDEELIRVLEAAAQLKATWRATRDQAVLAVLIYTGVRRTEALDLQVGHVDLVRSTLYVAHGKGDQARTIPLCREVKEYLSRWLAARPPANHDWLFSYGPGRRLSQNGLSQMLERAKVIAGFPGAPNIKPHSIRHRTATRLHENGADVRSIQAWLGHKYLSTTADYLHCDEKRLQSIAHLASFNPSTEDAEAFRTAGPAPEPPIWSRHASDPGSRLRRNVRKVDRSAGRLGGLR